MLYFSAKMGYRRGLATTYTYKETYMRKILLITLSCILLVGCKTTRQKEIIDNVASFTPTELPETDSVYEDYANHLLILKNPSSYTVGVKNIYNLYYSDDSQVEYSFDGILEAENVSNNPVAHITEYINGDAVESKVEGYYYDGRLYNDYNGVKYYEDMDYAALTAVMQTPISILSIKQEDILEISKDVVDDEQIFTISLSDDASYNYFLTHYDVSGIAGYDNVAVTKGVVKQTFNSQGYFVKEEVSFKVAVVIDELTTYVDYFSSVNYIKLNQTSVVVDDAKKEEQASYVEFQDIDTDNISDNNVQNDEPGQNATETFQKRLVSRLRYEKQEDGTYLTQYNDNESYTVDFENHQFTYTNYSSKYVYNWVGDTGVFGSSCIYDFNTDQASADCEDSVKEMIQNVKLYFQMELYYCGLSLDDLLSN